LDLMEFVVGLVQEAIAISIFLNNLILS